MCFFCCGGWAAVGVAPCRQTSFQVSLKTAVQVMKSKVVASDKNRVGVTFFGTKKTSDIDVGQAKEVLSPLIDR